MGKKNTQRDRDEEELGRDRAKNPVQHWGILHVKLLYCWVKGKWARRSSSECERENERHNE